MVTFNQPQFLYLAIALFPALLILAYLLNRFQKKTLSLFGRWELLASFSHFSNKTLSSLLLTLAIVSLSLAAAGPTLAQEKNGALPTLNAMIIIDGSKSMLAEDSFDDQSRLAATVLATEELLESYPDGHFGLAFFTDTVVVYAPTKDHQALRIILDDLLKNYPASTRGEGSAPVLALRKTFSQLEDQFETVKVVFFITDGGVSSSAHPQPGLDPVKRQLDEQDIQLVIVGVGDLLPTTIPIYSKDGELTGYHYYEGSVVFTALEEPYLRQLSKQTSDLYLKLDDPKDLVRFSNSHHLDSQPAAQKTVSSLVWIPIAFSLLFVFLLVLKDTHISLPRIF